MTKTNRPLSKPHLSHRKQNPNMELKNALAQLIDAYADAKASKNQILTAYATQELQRFLITHDLVPAENSSAGGFGETEETAE